MKLQKISILLLCLTATFACTNSSEQQHWTFSAPQSGGGDCDGPCPIIIIDTCSLGQVGEAFALVQMTEAEPVSTPNTCGGTPRYSSSTKESSVLVVESLGGDLPASERFKVLFLGSQFSSLDWEVGDFLLLSLRRDDGEWFATGALHATPSTNAIEADTTQASNDEYEFQLPSSVKELRAEFARVEQDYEAVCGAEEETDAAYHMYVREDPNCGFTGADQADEEKTGTPSDLDL